MGKFLRDYPPDSGKKEDACDRREQTPWKGAGVETTNEREGHRDECNFSLFSAAAAALAIEDRPA